MILTIDKEKIFDSGNHLFRFNEILIREKRYKMDKYAFNKSRILFPVTKSDKNEFLYAAYVNGTTFFQKINNLQHRSLVFKTIFYQQKNRRKAAWK